MKKLLMSFVAFSFSVLSWGQECEKLEKAFAESAKQIDKKATFKKVKEVMEGCERPSASFFDLGETYYFFAIETAEESHEREGTIQDLLLFYQKQDQLYPNSISSIPVRMALVRYRFMDDKKEVYTILAKEFEKNPVAFREVYALDVLEQLYWKFEYSKDSDPKKLYTFYDRLLNQTVSLVDQNKSDLEALRTKSETQILTEDELESVTFITQELSMAEVLMSNLRTALLKNIDCNHLGTYIAEDFESMPRDREWMLGKIRLLDQVKCEQQVVYAKMVLKCHEQNPTVDTFKWMGKMSFLRGDYQDSLNYFADAASLIKDPLERANVLYFAASQVGINADKSVAKKMLYDVVKLDPTQGRAYIQLAQLYAGASYGCATSELHKKVLYQKSIELVKSAMKADPVLKRQAESLLQQYAKHKLTKSEVKELKKRDYKLDFGCWINETIKLNSTNE